MKKLLKSPKSLIPGLLMLTLMMSGFSQADKLKTSASPEAENIHLASVKASVYDIKNESLIYAKNADLVVPIASITKLMTAMVVLDAKLDMSEKLTITRADRDALKNTYSRIRFGSKLSRHDLMLIALMSSENRAASALGRNYPGGIKAFVAAMNKKAKSLGMSNTRFVDSTGLSQENVSTARDLVKMVTAASNYEKIQQFTTTPEFVARFSSPRYALNYRNTNVLVRKGSWDINVSKTGYINEAGRCLVMLSEVGDRKLAMVFLDSFGKRTPIGDANRVKKWIDTGNSGRIAGAALRYERQEMKKLVASNGKNS
ncbi:MAG: D-alanyl-D-alanine endopeptidase [Pseudomonadales bacterium]|nr:D-alanyl-D-alanine endopeptidase [Pseudomonadales bacterium]